MLASQFPAPLSQARTSSLVNWKEPWTASSPPSLYRQEPCDSRRRGSAQGHTAALEGTGAEHDGPIGSPLSARAPAVRGRAPAPVPAQRPSPSIRALTRRHATQRREVARGAHRHRHGGALRAPRSGPPSPPPAATATPERLATACG